MNKTKLIFVMGFMQVGGIEKSLIRLCNALDPNTYDITVLFLCVGDGISTELPNNVKKFFISRNKTRSFSKQYSKMLSKCYAKIINLAYGNYNKIIKRLFYYLVKVENIFFKRYIKGLLKQDYYDVSIGFMQGEPSDVATSCICANKYVTFYRHGSVLEFLNDKKYYHKSDVIVTLSSGLKNELVKKRGLQEKKIRVIYNIYDIENIKSKSQEECELDRIDKLKLVTVARISPEKGIIQAIEAASLLKKSGVDFCWLFVGDDKSKYANTCKEKINEYGLQENVKIIGVRMNPYPYFRCCNIYVQPSEIECLSNAIVEALILQKPIISTNTYGAKELIDNYNNGLLCEFNSEALAESIIKLICDNDLRCSLIQGTKRIIANLESEMEKYYALFL